MKSQSRPLALLLGLFISTTSLASPPTVVLVHGANFSAKSWDGVRANLSKQHIQTLAPDLYSANEAITLRGASERLCQELKKLNAPAVLVGHSQGGAIITEAASLCRNSIQSLVYVAAVLPLPGEGIFDLLSASDNQHYDTCGALNEQTQTYDLKDFQACRKVFMQDLTQLEAYSAFHTMVNEPASIGNSKADYSAEINSSIPKFYIQTQNDFIIGKDTQDKIMARSTFQKVFSIESSHSPFFSHSGELAAMIAECSRISP